MPDFSTVSRRQKTLAVNIPYRGSKGPLHLLIDSTGIKVEGEGEWHARKHGGPKRRVWRKIHLGIDEQTLEVRAIEVTASHIGDAPILPDLLDQIPADAVDPLDADGLSRARQRLEDTKDALEAGDLGGAQSMAEQLARETRDLARDLDISSRIFGSERGKLARAAAAARDAVQRSLSLERAIGDAIPKVHDYLRPSDRERLERGARRQEQVQRASERLAERFRESPGGQPLSLDAADKLDAIRRSMKAGSDALAEGDPTTAAHSQEDAAQQLSDLRRALEKSGNSKQASGEDSGKAGSGRGLSEQERVELPDPNSYVGPVQFRRKVMRGMRESAPPEPYKEAVQRYYEGLLR